MNNYEIKENKLNKVKKNCKTIKTVISILQIFLIIGIICSAVGIVTISYYKNEVNQALAAAEENGASIDFDDFQAGIFKGSIKSEALINEGKYNVALNLTCIYALIVCSFVYGVFFVIKKIFKEIEQSESPFSDTVLKKLKALFIIISIASLISFGLGYAILTALVLNCIYCILDYGCAIQTEVDETL